MGTGNTAQLIVDSLAAEHGWTWVINTLIEEVKTAPGDELAAIGKLVDAAMASLPVTGEHPPASPS
jgi:hypothetical protein